MKHLILFLLLMNNLPLIAQTEKTVTLVVAGQGQSLDEATQKALRSAIEQAFGAFISSKTEMFNDQVVADQMASVSSGNIKSFEVLNQGQLPDGRWGVTLKAVVSVDKLTSFVTAKGVSIEIKGGLFAINIKQQILNEKAEAIAIQEMLNLLHEPMQISFDYTLESQSPKSTDGKNNTFEIPLMITAKANKNIDFCATYFIKTIAAVSLKLSEVDNYKSINKEVYPLTISYKGQTNEYFLRTDSSRNLINELTDNWEFFTSLFSISPEEKLGIGIAQIHSLRPDGRNDLQNWSISFPIQGQKVGVYAWNVYKTLAELEKLDGYTVKSKGVISQLRHGGYVVEESGGHGFVIAKSDIGGNYKPNGNFVTVGQDFKIANQVLSSYVANGYADWYLPRKEEFQAVFNKINSFGPTLYSYGRMSNAIDDFDNELKENGSRIWLLVNNSDLENLNDDGIQILKDLEQSRANVWSIKSYMPYYWTSSKEKIPSFTGTGIVFIFNNKGEVGERYKDDNGVFVRPFRRF